MKTNAGVMVVEAAAFGGVSDPCQNFSLLVVVSRTSFLTLRSAKMERLQQWLCRPFYVLILALILQCVRPAQALYFYIDPSSSTPKCFYEELPKDTLVVGA